jgi:hypothetical protein
MRALTRYMLWLDTKRKHPRWEIVRAADPTTEVDLWFGFARLTIDEQLEQQLQKAKIDMSELLAFGQTRDDLPPKRGKQ